ncbi:hypothetical protein BZA77DRAFT_383654 [Pyronema omphalodes]|nr:hypothetical protein BZA77DRAFT_383654 [Pyronema omphalodes]
MPTVAVPVGGPTVHNHPESPSGPATRTVPEAREDEPLLGRPGDVSQSTSSTLCRGLLTNLITGTAPLAQLGSFVLVGLIFTAIFTHPLMLFSVHPIMNTLAIVLAVQAILVLQPTHTPNQKRAGAHTHAVIWATSLAAFIAAGVSIEVHKKRRGIGHFESKHAIFGTIIYTTLVLQAIVGVLQFYAPNLLGGEAKAKAIYKYHRVSGYLILTAILVNVVLATYTPYAGNVLGIKTWTTVLSGVLVLAGIIPRVKKQKVQLWGRRG